MRAFRVRAVTCTTAIPLSLVGAINLNVNDTGKAPLYINSVSEFSSFHFCRVLASY